MEKEILKVRLVVNAKKAEFMEQTYKARFTPKRFEVDDEDFYPRKNRIDIARFNKAVVAPLSTTNDLIIASIWVDTKDFFEARTKLAVAVKEAIEKRREISRKYNLTTKQIAKQFKTLW